MKPPTIHWKKDRRDVPDRRVHPRNGRRQGDSEAERCPWCTSHTVERVGATHGVSEYSCRTCRESWVSVAADRRS
jgi:hypothetical protein